MIERKYCRVTPKAQLLTILTLPNNINTSPSERGLDKPLPLIEITYPSPLPDDKSYTGASCRDYKGRALSGRFVYDPSPGTVLPAGMHEVYRSLTSRLFTYNFCK